VDFIWSSLVTAVLRAQQRGLKLVPGHLDHDGASDQPVKGPGAPLKIRAKNNIIFFSLIFFFQASRSRERLGLQLS
jgi:hypothetical protein